VNLDRLTFETARQRDGRWVTRCPQLDIRRIAKTRPDAIQACVNESFARAYEIDCESRFPTAEGTTP
jgi:hypothetical protein